jgi:hypothetical protein
MNHTLAVGIVVMVTIAVLAAALFLAFEIFTNPSFCIGVHTQGLNQTQILKACGYSPSCVTCP